MNPNEDPTNIYVIRISQAPIFDLMSTNYIDAQLKVCRNLGFNWNKIDFLNHVGKKWKIHGYTMKIQMVSIVSKSSI